MPEQLKLGIIPKSICNYDNYLILIDCTVIALVLVDGRAFSGKDRVEFYLFWTSGLPEGVLCNHPCRSVRGPLVRGLS